jgi:hypothetical protein
LDSSPSVIGWSIPSIFVWVKARAQRKHLEECIDQIGKLDKNAIEDKIKGYYVHGKISEEHRQFLKDRISEYYEEEKGSDMVRRPRDVLAAPMYQILHGTVQKM